MWLVTTTLNSSSLEVHEEAEGLSGYIQVSLHLENCSFPFGVIPPNSVQINSIMPCFMLCVCVFFFLCLSSKWMAPQVENEAKKNSVSVKCYNCELT